jgi:hypothetical protein
LIVTLLNIDTKLQIGNEIITMNKTLLQFLIFPFAKGRLRTLDRTIMIQVHTTVLMPLAYNYTILNQGSLTEAESSVQLISCLR